MYYDYDKQGGSSDDDGPPGEVGVRQLAQVVASTQPLQQQVGVHDLLYRF